MKVTIYTLEDPITKDIKYIGITSSTMELRLKSHIKESKYKNKNRKSGKHRWILSLLDNNLSPIITEIEIIDDEYNYILRNFH